MIDWIRKAMAAPDPGWLPFVKVMFGFALLLVLSILAGMIALGSVKAETSFGLDIILGGLLTLSGGFASWAFRDPAKGTVPDTEAEAAEILRALFAKYPQLQAPVTLEIDAPKDKETT